MKTTAEVVLCLVVGCIIVAVVKRLIGPSAVDGVILGYILNVGWKLRGKKA